MMQAIHITAYIGLIAFFLYRNAWNRLERSLSTGEFPQPHPLSSHQDEKFEKNQLARNAHYWFFSRWFASIRYLLAGPQLILNSYKPGKAFSLPTPESTYVLVSSEAHVKELASAPQDVLSLHAASKELLQVEHTMDGIAVEDSMNANGIVHMRVLAVMLKNHLNQLHGRLESIVAEKISSELGSNGVQKQDGWFEIPIFDFTTKIIAAANSSVFFGNDMAHDQKFVDAVMKYPEELFTTAEILRMIPKWTVPIVAPILKRNNHASKFIVERARPLAEQRLAEYTKDPESQHHLDCLQFFVEASRGKNSWSAHRIIQVILGMLFASVHQPALSLVYALDDLCRHPEYVDLLRQDINECTGGAGTPDVENSPLLDSFLKESARLTPPEAISARRLAVKPFKFSDGTSVRAGDLACLPLNAIMLDPLRYQNASTFDGFRFIDQGKINQTKRFSSGGTDYPVWGLGNHTCPGRFYATRIMKIVLAQILRDFDIRFPDGQEESRYFNWRTSTIPYAKTSLLFRKKQSETA